MEKPCIRVRPLRHGGDPHAPSEPPQLEIPDDLPQASTLPAPMQSIGYYPAIPPPPPPGPLPSHRPILQKPAVHALGYTRKRPIGAGAPNLERLAFFGEAPADYAGAALASAEKKPRQECVNVVRSKLGAALRMSARLLYLVKRLEKSGHLPSEAESLKVPVILRNKIGRGISEEEAKKAKDATIVKLMRWQYDKIAKKSAKR